MAEQAEQTAGDEAAAEAMKKAAESGKQQDVSGQQRQAAQQSRQNQRGESQQARQQAEIGLQVVLGELDAAEREALRRLERELAELAEQIERLVRRQAGHNLDNRNLREIEAEPALIEAAGRDEDRAVEPTVARLSAGQEQTERNARDLSRPAEETPEAAEVAAALSRAAGEMERAAVFLRQDDLAAAYEPPQTRALDALRAALAEAEAERDRARQEIEDREREAIRERLVKVRDAQVAEVNEPTAELQAKRDAGERVGRRELLLPRSTLMPRQRELADETAEIVEAFGNVGGVAFVYAGNRAKTDMEAVANRLDDRDTGAVTQIAQRRVADTLDAMIESLTVEAKPERFDENEQPQQQGQEGQQGEQPPPLPPEAQLKLVQRLQQSIRDATGELSDLGEDAPAVAERLDAVAGEQGEVRSVLDQMLRDYSRGERGLGPEPDPATLLPDEAADAGDEQVEEQLDDRDLLDDLLGGGADAAPADDAPADAADEQQPAAASGGDAGRVGDYMARSRQRLSLSRDPGRVTQLVQDRAIAGLDGLIEQARQNQQQSSSSSSSSSSASSASSRRPQGQPQPGGEQAQAGGEQPQPQPGEAQANGQPADGQPADGGDGPAGADADLSGDIAESLAEWGQLTPRQRAAILDTRGTDPLDSYRELTERFYKSISDAAAGDE